MGRLEDVAGTRVVFIGVGHFLSEGNRLHGPIRIKVGLRPVDECVGACQLNEVGADVRGIDRIQLGGGAVMEPARVVLPDRPVLTPGAGAG